jgi:hypothetical protein
VDLGHVETRRDGWEARLEDVLRDAVARTFDARRWNCALFALACAEAVRGVPIPYRWLGCLEATVDAVLLRVERRTARRGDVVLAHVPQPSLGVCTGAVATFAGLSGLVEIPMRQVLICWRV